MVARPSQTIDHYFDSLREDLIEGIYDLSGDVLPFDPSRRVMISGHGDVFLLPNADSHLRPYLTDQIPIVLDGRCCAVVPGFWGGTIYGLTNWDKFKDETLYKGIALPEFGLNFYHINDVMDLVRVKKELGIDLTDAEIDLPERRRGYTER